MLIFGRKEQNSVKQLSSIKINDVIWTVVCNADLKKNDLVTIENVEGNKMIVKPVNSAEKPAETVEKAVSKNKKKN